MVAHALDNDDISGVMAGIVRHGVHRVPHTRPAVHRGVVTSDGDHGDDVAAGCLWVVERDAVGLADDGRESSQSRSTPRHRSGSNRSLATASQGTATSTTHSKSSKCMRKDSRISAKDCIS